MASSAAKPFVPPTAEQVRTHLERHPPRGPGASIAWLPLVAFIGAVAVWSMARNEIGVLAALLLLGALMLGISLRARRLRALESQTSRTQELLALRQWTESLRLAWRTLPKVGAMPEWHGRTVSALAHNLDRLHAYDAAIAAYDFLIDRLPADHPGSIQFRVQRAIAQLSNHQLLDADNELRRLRGSIEAIKGSPLAALYRCGVLAQQVLTNHHADALAQSDGLLEDLRPLGIEAGYGYALMALAHDTMTSAPSAELSAVEEHQRQAATWWSRATLLLPVGALVERFPAIKAITQRMAPASGDDGNSSGVGGSGSPGGLLALNELANAPRQAQGGAL